MFQRLHETGPAVTFEFEGEAVTARAGESVAAALLAHGVRHTRQSLVTAEPRAAYCLIGACFECLMEIDGRANRQACLTEVRDGMAVRRQARPGGDQP